MRSLSALSEDESMYRRVAPYQLPGPEKANFTTTLRKVCRQGSVLVLLAFLSGCVAIPIPSSITINDNKLQAIQPLQQGDVLVLDGENAITTRSGQSFGEAAKDYFTAGCREVSRGTCTIPNLITTILKMNPYPGRFAVKNLAEVQRDALMEEGPECAAGGDSILCRLNLSKTRVLSDRLRYAIRVKESFEANVHAPLYAPPFGIVSCGRKTVLEANVWDLPTEQFAGSFTVSAAGEFTMAAYMLHVAVYPETQKDAIERLAREIVERFTGSKPLAVD
jgi:hypothetical protein